MFVIVQEEYKREGLKWESIKCMDNSAALELLEGRLGIIDLLNEESMRGQVMIHTHTLSRRIYYHIIDPNLTINIDLLNEESMRGQLATHAHTLPLTHTHTLSRRTYNHIIDPYLNLTIHPYLSPIHLTRATTSTFWPR